MRKLIFMLLLFTSFALAQQAEELSPINEVYADDDTTTTSAFYSYGDSLHWLCSFADSVDLDVYYEYGNGGEWKTSSKLADVVSEVAIDTAITVNIAEPHLYGRFKYIFNSSGNAVGDYLRTWIRK